VRFGMARNDVRAALEAIGLPLRHARDRLDYFDRSNALQVEYIDGTVSFIGVSQGDGFSCSVYGVDPFDMEASDLFRLLAEHAGEAPQFDADEHCFRSTIVTLWDADEQYDHKGSGRRVVWAQLGVGDPRYLAAVDSIRGS
jgi:hypothetical protein